MVTRPYLEYVIRPATTATTAASASPSWPSPRSAGSDGRRTGNLNGSNPVQTTATLVFVAASDTCTEVTSYPIGLLSCPATHMPAFKTTPNVADSPQSHWEVKSADAPTLTIIDHYQCLPC